MIKAPALYINEVEQNNYKLMENEYQGTGTKWCCFHTLSIRYVIVYIVAPFLPVRSYFEAGA